MAPNEKELAVLRWIRAGCPNGVMEGDTFKISAAALRSRGLIRTAGRGVRWHAEITERGLEYLKEIRRQRAKQDQ
jgi:hypothetical protein